MNPNQPRPSVPPQTNGGEGQLSREERELIKNLSAKCKVVRNKIDLFDTFSDSALFAQAHKDKDPNFDSKRFLQHELNLKCGSTRTVEIMAYVVEYHFSSSGDLFLDAKDD
jgi:molybdopterin/thiamine biosynthesis adenylyltransferase